MKYNIMKSIIMISIIKLTYLSQCFWFKFEIYVSKTFNINTRLSLRFSNSVFKKSGK